MAHMDGTWMNQMWWAMWIPSVINLGALVGWASGQYGGPRNLEATRVPGESWKSGSPEARSTPTEFRSRLEALEGHR